MNNGIVALSRSHGSKDIRVLIADPDESLMAEYREHSREGFEIVTVPNGLECVDRLREQVPDVLVLEPQLPWGGGDDGVHRDDARRSRSRQRAGDDLDLVQ